MLIQTEKLTYWYLLISHIIILNTIKFQFGLQEIAPIAGKSILLSMIILIVVVIAILIYNLKVIV